MGPLYAKPQAEHYLGEVEWVPRWGAEAVVLVDVVGVAAQVVLPARPALQSVVVAARPEVYVEARRAVRQ